MRLVIGKLRQPQRMPPPIGEDMMHAEVVDHVLRTFDAPELQLLVNKAGRPLFGVASGLYPDVVALDGTESGVAWVLEVETPDTLADEVVWERWKKIVEAAPSAILVVPSGFGDLVSEITNRLGFSFGLVYEFRLDNEGIQLTAAYKDSKKEPGPCS